VTFSKHKLPALLVLSLLLLACVIVLETSCSKKKVELKREIDIRVDRRVELLQILQLITRQPTITKISSPYFWDVLDAFAPQEKLPVFDTFRQMVNGGLTDEEALALFLRLHEPPDLSFALMPPDYVIEAAGGKDQVDRLLKGTFVLMQKSDAMKFFGDQQQTYDECLDNVRDGVDTVITALEQYMRMDVGHCTFIASPLQNSVGRSLVIHSNSAAPEAVLVLGPVDRDYDLTLVWGPADRLGGMAWPTFSRSALDPLLENDYSDWLERTADSYNPVSRTMLKLGLRDWKAVVAENIGRAISNRMIAQRSGDKWGEWYLRMDKNRGFVWAVALYEKLKEFESSPDQYPTLADFMPELLKVFEADRDTTGEAS
jgi:hypothetical protein